MQMYANEGTLAEHLRKVSIPAPALLYLLRTCGSGTLLRLPVPEDCAAVSTTRGWAEPRSLSCRAAQPLRKGRCRERGRGSRPALVSPPFCLLGPSLQHPGPFGGARVREGLLFAGSEGAAAAEALPDKKAAAGAGRAREPAAIPAPGEAAREEGRSKERHLEEGKAAAEKLRLPQPWGAAEGLLRAPWSSPGEAGGLRVPGDVGDFLPRGCTGARRAREVLESSLNREGLRTQGRLAPEFRPCGGREAGL